MASEADRFSPHKIHDDRQSGATTPIVINQKGHPPSQSLKSYSWAKLDTAITEMDQPYQE